LAFAASMNDAPSALFSTIPFGIVTPGAAGADPGDGFSPAHAAPAARKNTIENRNALHPVFMALLSWMKPLSR
jgi:hypothetical protein